MKITLSLVLIIASIGYLLAGAPSATEIASLTTKTGNRGSVTVTFAFGTGTPTATEIIFGTGDSVAASDTATYTFPESPTANQSFTVSITFPTVGTYNVFLKNKEGEPSNKQTAAGSIVISPSLAEVTGISPQTCYINTELTVTFTLPKTIGLKTGDVLIFSKSATLTDVPATEQHTLTTTPTASTPLAPKFTFTTLGTYNLFVKSGATSAQQTGVSMIVYPPAPADNLITAVTPVTATAGTATDLSFTLSAASALKADNKIVFSTTSPPTDSDTKITVSTASSSTTYTGSVTFTTAGTYTVWVDNSTPTQQTGLSIVVSTGASFISMSLALGALLLLF